MLLRNAKTNVPTLLLMESASAPWKNPYSIKLLKSANLVLRTLQLGTVKSARLALLVLTTSLGANLVFRVWMVLSSTKQSKAASLVLDSVNSVS